jgi:hemerythrin superfamily protein
MATPSPQADALAKRSTGILDGDIDAIELLLQDHQNVKELFEQYAALSDRSLVTKRKLALKICLELTKHATAEEEIFYPAVRAACGEAGALLDEALVEHDSARDLIAQIQEMDPEDALYDAKIKVLGEQIAHHVQEEESELLPMAGRAGLDLLALGDEMSRRKEEISTTL